MNRRILIRTIAIGTVAVASYPVYKWTELKGRPDFLYLNSQKNLISELAETIIPATDTPGAKDTLTENFIIRTIHDCTDIASQNNFIKGLKNLEELCFSSFNLSYVSCTIKQREIILTHFEEESKRYPGIIGKIQNKLLGKPFFYLLREYTVQGYCTSMLGATKGLAYEFIPGTFDGCTPLKPLQKSWATK